MNKSDINAHLGRRLKMERRRQDLTQSQLAERCGVTFQMIHKYEVGAVTISAGMLWQLAEALDIGVGDLFPRVDARPQHDGASNGSFAY